MQTADNIDYDNFIKKFKEFNENKDEDYLTKVVKMAEETFRPVAGDDPELMKELIYTMAYLATPKTPIMKLNTKGIIDNDTNRRSTNTM